MTKRTSPPTTRWVSPPGATIADMLDEANLTQADLALRLSVTPKHVNKLISGAAPVSDEVAVGLARVLGSTTEFWLNREANYRAALATERATDRLDEDVEWAKLFPYNEMAKRQWVKPTKHNNERVGALLEFLGVASVAAYKGTYAEYTAQFRKSTKHTVMPEAVVAWLRRAELSANAIGCTVGSTPTQDVIAPLRQLTVLSVELQVDAARKLCAEHGIALVIEKALPGCPLWGATRWLTPSKAMIALSLRYRTDDHFWFTLFHELGHVLLHSKKNSFLDSGDSSSELEREADEFAADRLIPPSAVQQLRRIDQSHAAVMAFAKQHHIAPGIVVGRMQRLKLIPYNFLHKLKQDIPDTLS